MEGGTHLMRVIQEMHSEIKQLERENKALRGEINQLGSRMDTEIENGNNFSQARKEEGAPKGVLRRNASVPLAQKLQEQTGTTMTVRRYSMSTSLISTPGYSKSRVNMKRNASTGTLDVNGTVQNAGSDNGQLLATKKDNRINIPVKDLIPKSSSFQGHMRKCRGKVKAVTFLLPTDMKKYQESQKTLKGSENQCKNHLSPIMEKDL
ncbi:putative coiled-coil domain-containing protein 195 [Xenopus laevis]|uniref:Coiled-coil domain-containing protein 195 n=1 Tax=Xenopus laevis TaxID=8355 RepID=A0A8J1KU92_XENLA|nr:putative coiled-coil domain-containing protein 195 [Xenopus laevis]